MKLLFLNASPKRKFSTSQYFLDLLKIQMAGCKTKEIKLTGKNVYEEIFNYFKEIDALVIALPVYVDGVPSHVLDFLTEAEKYCKQENCKFKLYIVSNCGFYEGKQCKNQLAIMRSFCSAAGLEWGAGLGIGAGEMLNIIRLTNPIFELLKLILAITVFIINRNFIEGLTNYNWISVFISLLIFTAFSSGLFISMFKMQRLIKKKKTVPDFYTGVKCCPRFLFTIFACCYWIIRALYHGTGFLQLYKNAQLNQMRSKIL
jgi:multimeric flavodoxin WrbA